jgi:hypothetical protein
MEMRSAIHKSLCESCALMREMATPRSRFLLCQQSQTDAPANRAGPPVPLRIELIYNNTAVERHVGQRYTLA